MEFNILLTSAGKKVPMVRAFKEVLKEEKDIEGKVICVDQNPLSPSFYEADDSYVVPSALDAQYAIELLKICRENKINMLIPFIDAELLPLAENAFRFKEIRTQLIISKPTVIATCNDKYKTYRFLSNEGIPTPKTFLPEEIEDIDRLDYPLLVKPRRGFSSQDIFKVVTPQQLEFFLEYQSNLVIQEYITGTEFTLDALADLQGNVINVVPRERIEVQAGLSTKGRTVKNKMLMELGRHVMEKLGVIGPANIQCFTKDGRVQVTEINPRFGGGFPLSLAAGANYPKLLIDIIRGYEIKPMIGKFEDKLVMLRYYEAKFIKRDNK